jgi:hypothetical protein
LGGLFRLVLRGQGVKGSKAACTRWLVAWVDVQALAERGSIRTLEDFDEAFGGTQSIFNWIQDAEMELHNAGLEDPAFHRRRVELCEQFLQRFSSGDSLLVENMRRALASSCFDIGDRDRGDALFKEWLTADPRWGWGWIGWSDCYGLFATAGNNHFERAESLLKQGLAVEGVRDKEDMMERLTRLNEERGSQEEASRVRRKSKAAPEDSPPEGVIRIKSTLDFGEEGLPLDKLPELRDLLSRGHEQILGQNAEPKAWPQRSLSLRQR